MGSRKIHRIFFKLSRWIKLQHFSLKSPKIHVFHQIMLSLVLHNTVLSNENCSDCTIHMHVIFHIQSIANTHFTFYCWVKNVHWKIQILYMYITLVILFYKDLNTKANMHLNLSFDPHLLFFQLLLPSPVEKTITSKLEPNIDHQ